MRTFSVIAMLLLSGCDAWPTIVDNGTEKPIRLQYLHRDYGHWSAEFRIKAGVAMSLERAHWMHDITGIKINDGHVSYQWSVKSLRRLGAACPSNKIGRNTGFAANCYLVYKGRGQLMATDQEPSKMRYATFGNGG